MRKSLFGKGFKALHLYIVIRQKAPYWIVNKLNDGTPEIYLYGDIYPYEDCVSASALAKELRDLERTCTKINVRINSNGGSVFEGIAIFNLLRNSRCEIDTYIDGIAASMASVIAMAGKKVYMSKYARLMTHKPSGGAWGNADELRRAADEIDACEELLSGIYVSKTGMTKKQVSEKLLNGTDSYFNADAALKAKLIDGIYDGEPVTLPDGITDSGQMWNYYGQIAAKTNDTQTIILL